MLRKYAIQKLIFESVKWNTLLVRHPVGTYISQLVRFDSASQVTDFSNRNNILFLS